jgi:hypothetical protein
MVDKIASYTGRQLDQFDILQESRAGENIAVLTIGAVDMPMVFENPGTYLGQDANRGRRSVEGRCSFVTPQRAGQMR